MQFELIAVSFVDLTVVYQQLHAADPTSRLSCNVRDIAMHAALGPLLSSVLRVCAVIKASQHCASAKTGN